MTSQAMESRAYSQARIRLNEEGAREILVALHKHEDDLLDGRDTVRGTGSTAPFNKRLAAIRRVLDEVERTYKEQGWTNDGELQQSDEA